MAKSGLPSFIKTGAVGLEEAAGPSIYISVKDGEKVEMAPIGGVDDIISFHQHAIWRDEGNSPIFPCLKNKDCPGCMLGDTPRFRALMKVLVRSDAGMEEKLFAFGVGLFKDFIAIEEAMEGSMSGSIIRVSRTGTGMTTKWKAMPTGRTVKVPGEDEQIIDILEHIGPTEEDDIIKILEEAKMWPPKPKSKKSTASKEDDTKGKPAAKKEETKPKPAPKAAPAKEETEEDDEDWDSVDFEGADEE